MHIYRWELLAVCHQPEALAISIVIVEMFLICRVTSHEHIFKGLYEFWLEAPHGESPPPLPCLVAIGLAQVEI